jgi:arsenite methyltransferase
MLNPRITSPEEIRKAVKEQYAKAATDESSCCGGSSCCGPSDLELDPESFGRSLYGEEAGGAGDAIEASLGCGVPTLVADLAEGETVLDLGSGGGADVLISAQRVGPDGRAIGLDMTDEMLDLAKRNAAAAGVENVDFLKGEIEDVPLPDNSVDVVISNCVINLSADKRQVLGEAARVLRPGGRFAVSDTIADPEMDDATRADAASWTGCIAGALTEAEFRETLESVGFESIEVIETHRVHDQAASAIVRATVPS